MASAQPTTVARSPAQLTERIIAALAALISVYAMRRADPDMWGYLTYGRLFLEQGRVVSWDMFAYTAAGHKWVDHEYAAQILLWLAYQSGGAAGLIALKSVLGIACLSAVYVGLREVAPRTVVWLPLFLFTSATVSRFFMFRPQLFTLAFFAAYVAILHRYLRTGRAALWALPAIMLVWANTHGGFLAGFGAIGLVLLLKGSENLTSGAVVDARTVLRGTAPLWRAVVACVAVTFLTPQGVNLWAFVLTEVTHGTNRELIAEWSPTTFGGDTWSAVMLTASTVLLICLGWLAQRHAAKGPGPRPVFWMLSCVPIIVMAYVSVRHVPIAMIWMAPVLAHLSAATLANKSSLPVLWRVFSGFSALALCAPAIVVALQPRPVIETGGTVLGSRHPCRVVEFLRHNQLAGNVYNPLWWGSYITWELYPKILVSMDGRNISLFPDEMVRENLLFYASAAEFADIDAPLRYASDFLLVPTDAPVLTRLKSDRRWTALYDDSDAALFVRADNLGGEVAAAQSRAVHVDDRGPCVPILGE